MRCTVGGFGLWTVRRFTSDPNLIWIKPVNDEAKLLAKLTVDGTVGVTANELNIPTTLGDTLL